jgi:hypothetical protein
MDATMKVGPCFDKHGYVAFRSQTREGLDRKNPRSDDRGYARQRPSTAPSLSFSFSFITIAGIQRLLALAELPVGENESPIAEEQPETNQGYKESRSTTSAKAATQNTSWVCNSIKAQRTTKK